MCSWVKLRASHPLLQQPRPPEDGAPAKSRMSQKLQTIRIATRFYCAIRHVRTHLQRRHTHTLCPDWMPRGSAGSKSCPELTSRLLPQCLQGNARELQNRTAVACLWEYNYDIISLEQRLWIITRRPSYEKGYFSVVFLKTGNQRWLDLTLMTFEMFACFRQICVRMNQ